MVIWFTEELISGYDKYLDTTKNNQLKYHDLKEKLRILGFFFSEAKKKSFAKKKKASLTKKEKK